MTISVIIPVYNGERFVNNCLEALARQTRQPDEVIVVDDGSTDQSAALAQVKSVRVIHQSHQGPAAARNTGIQNARGELILFTDIDCEPHPDWVLEMEKSLSSADIVGVKGSYGTNQPGIVARLVQFEFEERYDLMERSPTIDFIDTYSAGFRNQVLKEIGGFDVNLLKNEDVDLSYRLAKAGKRLVFNRKALVFHHHPESWTAYFIAKLKKAYWRMIVYRQHPSKAIKDTYTPQLLKFQILLALLGLGMLIPVWVDPLFIWFDIIVWGVLLLTTIPFTQQVMRKDSSLTLWAPVFLIVRSFAFVIGTILGMFGLIGYKSGIDRI